MNPPTPPNKDCNRRPIETRLKQALGCNDLLIEMMMTERLPKRKRIYETEWWSSSLWNQFVPKHGDIIVCTPAKTGTTWVQTILLYLIFLEEEKPMLRDVSPWLDAQTEDVVKSLDSQAHRRFIKTHTPLDGIPYWSEVIYLVVGRDGRDAFMSAFNHYNSNIDSKITLSEYWQKWITMDKLSQEPQPPLVSDKNDRLKYFCHYFRTFWDYRHLKNIHFVHYNDLLADLSGEVKHIADLVDIYVTEDDLISITESVKFSSIKKKAKRLYGKELYGKGGAQSFINKGTNGRWKTVLSEADINIYLEIVRNALSPECSHWLENGRYSASNG